MKADFRHRRLGYLVLQVPDIAQTTRFLTDVTGLDCVEASRRPPFLTYG